MAYSEYCRKMERMQHCIKLEHTGCADELADKLGISRRTFFNYLEILRDEGKVIKFSRNRKTYYYED